MAIGYGDRLYLTHFDELGRGFGWEEDWEWHLECFLCFFFGFVNGAF